MSAVPVEVQGGQRIERRRCIADDDGVSDEQQLTLMGGGSAAPCGAKARQPKGWLRLMALRL